MTACMARAYIEARHYSGTWPVAVLRYGLLDVSEGEPRLAGVAVLSVPVSKRALQLVFPGLVPYAESLDLGRFVLEGAVSSAASGNSTTTDGDVTPAKEGSTAQASYSAFCRKIFDTPGFETETTSGR